MTNAEWQPEADRGWGFTFAGDAARRVWNILDHLSRAMDGPDGNLIADRVAGDTERGLFRQVVRWTCDDIAVALGRPQPTRRSIPMTFAEKVDHRPRLLENARGMLADVEVQLEAIERMPEIVSTIQSATSRADAAGRLQQPPFSYSDWQAFHVLEMTVSSQTAAGIDLLRQRKEELTEAVQSLERPIEPPDASE